MIDGLKVHMTADERAARLPEFRVEMSVAPPLFDEEDVSKGEERS